MQYGDGSAPVPALVAIPSTDGSYFTEGKRYPVIRHEAYVYIVRCDRGHERVISMEDGNTSAHLPPIWWQSPWPFTSRWLGTFSIKLA